MEIKYVIISYLAIIFLAIAAIYIIVKVQAGTIRRALEANKTEIINHFDKVKVKGSSDLNIEVDSKLQNNEAVKKVGIFKRLFNKSK